ncbi:MAG: peptide chain release factor N(5)-glutamine methyltransferase [Candidatus Babeliaceae bacterium]|nr:peptide chain release factor N(5)-glutamine methyltransferase [Candidatus Babeliaceae bacterium]
MNISKAHALYTQKLLTAYNNQQTASQVAWWLLEKATSKNRSALLLEKDISENAQHEIELWISQIIYNHMPVQYILGSVSFLDIDIAVQAPILIPRPETEQWCQELITLLRQDLAGKTQKSFNLLDLCSGTGCIALSIAHAFPDADTTALDIDRQACKLIQLNAEKNGIKNCTIIESDLFSCLPTNKKYSIITANPPYITQQEWHELEPNVKNWESPQALVANNNGLEIIEKIITMAPQYLSTHINDIPQVWIEIGQSQAEHVTDLFKKADYTQIATYKDMYGKNRVITGSL